MIKLKMKWVLFSLLPIVLFACAVESKVELQYEVKVILDGNPAAQARVLIDGTEVGATDESGTFSELLTRMPGAEVKVYVVKEAPGYVIEPWEGSFEVKKPEKGMVDTYPLDAFLVAVKYFTVKVTDRNKSLEGAKVTIDDQEPAITDATGEMIHKYSGAPDRKMAIKINKKGYVHWKKTVKIQPGQVLEAALFQPSVLVVTALTEQNGEVKGLPGVEVTVGKKALGKTDADGTVSYVYRGAPGKAFRVTMSVPGHLPSTWKTKVVLDGRKTVKRYFYPVEPKPIRTGIYGYSGNDPDEDLTAALDRTEEAVGNILFSHMIFREVPSGTLKEKIKQAETDIETMTSKGWWDTPLIGTLDAVILGSVSVDDRGFIVETKVYTSDGKLVLSQINRARRKKNIKDVAKKVVRKIMEQYPFQGTMVSEKEGDFKVNIGKSGYQLKKGMEFALVSSSLNRDGKVVDQRDIGTIKVRKVEAEGSWARVVDILSGETAMVGQRAVRRIITEEGSRSAEHSLVLLVKGGVPPDVDPLPGVNVYLDDRWVGTTGPDGRARLPVKIGRTYDLLLYRHGYQQWTGKVKAQEDSERKEFVLEANNALFKVQSQPSGAKVYIDGTMVGRTPITDGKSVPFGFHTLKISAGGDYRVWEEVVEFNSKVVDLSGSSRINLVMDYVAMGKRAEQKGDIDTALAAYSSPKKDHPDYSDARFRMAQLFMDKKEDYPGAIREFENVLSLPENQQLIYKQFSVTYTNLGHAYYEMGSELVLEDKQGAIRSFTSAIENLERAMQNTRFFPNRYYNEAVHDTHYYLARSYHKLYLITRKETLLGKADFAWRNYFDFFPKELEEVGEFAQMRDAAQKNWTQIQDLM